MCASFGQVFIKLWMRYSNRKHPSLFSTGRVVPLLPVMVCQKSTLKAANSEVIIMTTTLILHIKRLKTTPGLGTLLHGQKKHRSPRHGHLHQRSDAPQTQAKTCKDRQRGSWDRSKSFQGPWAIRGLMLACPLTSVWSCVWPTLHYEKETLVSLSSEMCQVLPSIAVDHQGTVFTLCEGNEQRHPCIASIIVHGKILLSSGQAKKGRLSRSISLQRMSFLTSFLYPKAFLRCSGSLLVTESSFVLLFVELSNKGDERR